MDAVKKWTIYLIFLVAGFATGIGTLGLFPQFWLRYGITGLVVHMVFLGILGYLAVMETETVMRSGYYFVGLYRKLLRRPSMIIAILITVLMFISYYSANVMLSLLSPVLGTGTLSRLVAKVIMLGIIFVILTRAKEKTFAIMAIGSAIFVIAVTVTAIAFKTQIPENAAFLGMAKHMLIQTHSLSLGMIKSAAERAIYGVGLGFAFYLMLGSFLNERFNPKLIVGVGILIQFIIGILSTIIVVYSLGPTTPDRLLQYVYGGEEGAIELMGELPTILAEYKTLLLLIAISVFFAGVTSLLPTAEVALQSIEALFKVGRNKAAAYVIGASLLIGIVDSPPTVADMMLKAVTTALFFTALFEMYPLIGGREKPTSLALGVMAVSSAVFLVGGLYALYDVFRDGGIYILSGLLALIILAFGIFGSNLIPEETVE